MNSRPLNDAVAQYERATQGYRQLFDGWAALPDTDDDTGENQ